MDKEFELIEQTNTSCESMHELLNIDLSEFKTCSYTINDDCSASVFVLGDDNGKFKGYSASGNAKEATARDTILVTLVGNGGTSSTANIMVVLNKEYGELPTASRSGYNFAGWYSQISGGEEITKDTVVSNEYNHEIYAHWSANNYTVTLNGVSGVIPVTEGWTNSNDNSTCTKDITYDTVYGVLPTPTKEGYTFAGWYLDELYLNEVTSSTTLVSSLPHMLYAKWIPGTYTVTFDAQGGSVSLTSKSVTNASAYGELPTPTKANNTFNGWFTQISGGNEITASTIVNIAENQTIYAQWTPLYSIILNYTGNFKVGSLSSTAQTGDYSTTDTDWNIYFVSSGTLTITLLPTNVDLYLVGGGGGGGGGQWNGSVPYRCGGGGGGGGYISSSLNTALSLQTGYSIVIGAGGSGGYGSGSTGGRGGTTTGFGLSAEGGYGGYYNGNGGAGTGAGGRIKSTGAQGTAIIDDDVYYGAGGGGGDYHSYDGQGSIGYGAGGATGGGNGGAASNYGSSGQTNTGAGGGGAGGNGAYNTGGASGGGSGGSGVVIMRNKR